jgi:PAS domain S-box-containing protein
MATMAVLNEPEDRRVVAGLFETAHSVIQARLAAIIESSDDAILSKTLDGVIQTWNLGAQHLFGYTEEEAVGQHISILIPEDRADEENEIIARISSGERVDHFESVRIAKDGTRVDISLTISPIRDGSGQVIGASKVARAIGDRKRIETALREEVARKDEFLAVLAHELRNPLAPLRNGLRIMRIAGNDRRMVDDAREMMERQLGHMVRLVDDLLDISRINQRKIELRRSVVALADVVGSAVETARPAIDAGGHSLKVSVPDAPIFLYADLTRLAQVFSNLLTNSAKYTVTPGTVWLEASVADGHVSVTIRDMGIGIPGYALHGIFDMFSQVDRNLERGSGGLGIGLALVKAFVEMHGGKVRAASDGPGKGSQFTVQLPVVNPNATAVVTEANVPVMADRRRILIADDNHDSAQSLATLLRLIGHDVYEAYDGEEAVARAEVLRPDVILMDVGMPKISGYVATRRIRERQWSKNTLIIALTGWGQSTDRQHSHDAGCDDHLVKPVALEELNTILLNWQQTH